jgi:hypothetical protein
MTLGHSIMVGTTAGIMAGTTAGVETLGLAAEAGPVQAEVIGAHLHGVEAIPTILSTR